MVNKEIIHIGGKAYKKCQIVILSTNNSTGLFTTRDCLQYSLIDKVRTNNEGRHLYILSDDEINKDDWYLNLEDNTINKANDWIYVSICKKIIASTDSLTIGVAKNGNHSGYPIYIPKPPDSFIQKFIERYNEGNPITEVLVELQGVKRDYIVGKSMGEPGENDKFVCPICKDSISPYGNKYFDCFECGNIKIALDNTITIKSLKDSWNREEVIEFAKKYGKEISKHTGVDNDGEHCYCSLDKDKWIEENL
jgi:hypothetical protein